MLFQAGMGLALVFWGVSEPITHYSDPPFHEAEPNTTAAAQLAMQYSFFHWGLHAWGVFALVGLAVAYFNFRRDARGIISPIFYPLLGERINGPIGKAIDIVAILVTLIGVAVSLGQGGLQIGAGFDTSLGYSNTLTLQLIIIVGTAVAYMLSAATPTLISVKWLSNISFIVGGFLVVYLLIVGPTVSQINALTQGIGDYLQNLLHMSLNVNAFNQDTDFLGKFTGFYWGWWITWAPFVGVFAARISRGRTIREFILGMLIVPTLICAAWFAIAGGRQSISTRAWAARSLRPSIRILEETRPRGSSNSCSTIRCPYSSRSSRSSCSGYSSSPARTRGPSCWVRCPPVASGTSTGSSASPGGW